LEEISKENQNIRKIQKHIIKWVKENEMPPNVLSTYIRMEKEENERNKKEEYERIQTTMLEGENDV